MHLIFERYKLSNIDINFFNNDKYIAHYTNLEAAILILDSKKIRLGHKNNTNDLYENNKNWFFEEPYPSDMHTCEIFDCKEIKKSIENKINKHIQIFSTIGYQEKRTLYNRPRAWAQYGDNHNGVCLIFNKDKLIEKFNNNNIIKSLYGKMTYIDWINIIQSQGYYKTPNDIKKLSNLLNSPELLFEEVNKNHSLNTKLFIKDIDWEHENEYRFLAFSKNIDNIYIDYNDSLEAIVLGANINYRLRSCFKDDAVKRYHIKYNDYNEYEYLQIE